MTRGESVAQGRFVVLDGMRGLAALVVITDHVYSSTLTGLLPGRYLAVDFFFLLSGFVLAHAYGERLRGGMTPLAFMRARLVRLYPLYLLGAFAGGVLALYFALQGWSAAEPWQVMSAGIFALFLLPCPPPFSVWHDAPYSLNGPSWSLFFELFANLLFALLGRWISPAICFVFMAIGAVWLVPTAFAFGQLDGGFAWSNFVAGFPRVLFGFFAGVWMYQSQIWRRLPALPPWAAYVALLAIFMIPAQGVWRAVFDLAAVLIGFPLLLAFCAGAQVGGRLAAVSVWVGAASYGVYILHVPLWGWLSRFVDQADLILPGFVNVGLVAGSALAAALILDRFFDRPVRRILGARL